MLEELPAQRAQRLGPQRPRREQRRADRVQQLALGAHRAPAMLLPQPDARAEGERKRRRKGVSGRA